MNIPLRNSVVAYWERSGAADYYRGLSVRDQRIAQGAGAVVVLLLVYALLWQPVHSWRTDNEARYAEAAATLRWMHANEAQARLSVYFSESSDVLFRIARHDPNVELGAQIRMRLSRPRRSASQHDLSPRRRAPD